MRKRILNQPIDILDINEATNRARLAFIHKEQLRITTLNSEMIVNASKNIEFQAAINNSHLIVPDGTGIVWALKLKGFENVQRVAGIDLAEKILEIANELGKKVAVFGGKKEVLEKVCLVFKEKYPKIQITNIAHGYHGEEKDVDIAREIAPSGADLILVALGAPKQEIWINKNAHLFPKSILIGIGGSLDVWSGEKPRAPVWVRKIHSEWLFRALIEPKRIPRVLVALPTFVLMVLKSKVKKLIKSLPQIKPGV